MRNQTSDLQILQSNAPTLSQQDCGEQGLFGRHDTHPTYS